MKKVWTDFGTILASLIESLSQEWPEELPPEAESKTEAFWMEVSRCEMRTRKTLSAKIRKALDERALPAMTPLEEWLLRRRIEWACQLGMAKMREGLEPPLPLIDILHWALVETWETDGCQSLWLHAERGGEMHPEAEDWLKLLE